jgi:choline kinase
LLPLGRQSAIEWQISALRQCGVKDICVVVGYHARDVEAVLARAAGRDLSIRALYNPFYKIADNLASCWLARGEMNGDFVVINGDTLFEPAILSKLLASPLAAITVTIDHKDKYDDDDMKVRIEGTRLREIGKSLSLHQVNGESIGMVLFRGQGPALFARMLDDIMHTPEGVKWWYLRAIGKIAETHPVETCSIKGLAWGEIDFPEDYTRAQALVARFKDLAHQV